MIKTLTLAAFLALLAGCGTMDRRRQQPAAVGVIIITDKEVKDGFFQEVPPEKPKP